MFTIGEQSKLYSFTYLYTKVIAVELLHSSDIKRLRKYLIEKNWAVIEHFDNEINHANILNWTFFDTCKSDFGSQISALKRTRTPVEVNVRRTDEMPEDVHSVNLHIASLTPTVYCFITSFEIENSHAFESLCNQNYAPIYDWMKAHFSKSIQHFSISGPLLLFEVIDHDIKKSAMYAGNIHRIETSFGPLQWNSETQKTSFEVCLTDRPGLKTIFFKEPNWQGIYTQTRTTLIAFMALSACQAVSSRLCSAITNIDQRKTSFLSPSKLSKNYLRYKTMPNKNVCQKLADVIKNNDGNGSLCEYSDRLLRTIIENDEAITDFVDSQMPFYQSLADKRLALVSLVISTVSLAVSTLGRS